MNEGRLRPMLERAWDNLSAAIPNELQETVSSEKKVSVVVSTAVEKALIRHRGRWWNREMSGENDEKLKVWFGRKRMNLGYVDDLQRFRIGTSVERWRIIRKYLFIYYYYLRILDTRNKVRNRCGWVVEILGLRFRGFVRV